MSTLWTSPLACVYSARRSSQRLESAALSSARVWRLPRDGSSPVVIDAPSSFVGTDDAPPA